MGLKPPVSEKDHLIGDFSSDMVIVEYGDFECPYCGAAYPFIKNIEKTMEGIAFVFRNFPLQSSHPHAMEAAMAAESASNQGKFWEMHDTLFENQENLSHDKIYYLAEDIGLDMVRFSGDMKSISTKEKVEKDIMSGIKSGVNGTPTFFVNGTRFDGPPRALKGYLQSIRH